MDSIFNQGSINIILSEGGTLPLFSIIFTLLLLSTIDALLATPLFFTLMGILLLFTLSPSPLLLISFTLLILLPLVLYLATINLRTQQKKPSIGMEQHIGQQAEVIGQNKNHYLIKYLNEEWIAKSPSPLKIGEQVTIQAIKGITLHVLPIGDPND